ncbi:MAG TPA: amidohydrolase family protein [Acidobacteriaceae bacterium]|nr:amidohydrolase family protein [Acidobacteriaceae bacterium]
MHKLLPFAMRRLVLAFALALGFCLAASAQQYDIVIKNGRVMDPETGLDAIRNVAIQDKKIVAISTGTLRGKMVIDATGLVVAPGFIDLHSHGQDAENYRYKAMDGVTTALELERGVYPVAPWYAERAGKALINYGASSGHIPVVMNVLHDTGGFLPRDHAITDTATPAQQAEILAELDEGLREGGIGIGMGLAYTPTQTPADIIQVFELAAHWKEPIFVHMRTAGGLVPGVVDSLQEMIADAAITGASVHIVHINSMSNKLTPLTLEMIHGARARGLDVTTEAYPYIAGATQIESSVFNPGWQKELDISYGDLQWVATGERLTEESFNRYRKQGGSVILFTNTEEMVRKAMADPMVMIASDGLLSNGHGHPRSAGTYARLLGVYVREQKVLPLMEAIRRASLAPAQRLEAFTPQMQHKGRLQVGADADIDVFDPVTVIDKATFQKPAQYSEGFRYVLVGGTPVVRDGHLDEAVLPGQAVRTR